MKRAGPEPIPHGRPRQGPSASADRRASASAPSNAARGRPAGPRASRRVPERHHDKENADRRHPRGRDPRGGGGRKQGRGVRLRVAEQAAARRQHLPRQGHPGRAVAAGGLRRLRRQPPRVPGLLGNPSRLLPDPQGRPRGAARRGGRARPRGRGGGGPREAEAARPQPQPPARAAGRGRRRRRPRTRCVASEPAEIESRPRRRGSRTCRRPSAAAGDIDIDVPEEPEARGDRGDARRPRPRPRRTTRRSAATTSPRSAPPRKPRQRRYKIQEVVKVRQILLVQVVKEERGNKGAALTTYLSPRRPLLRADAQHRARRRHQPQDHQRRRPQEAEGDLRPRSPCRTGAGLIIRTAGASRTKTEIKRDYEYLLRQWEQIRDLTLKSIAPVADLRGRQPDQAGDPRPLQPRHGRDPGRRRARLPRGQGLHEDAHAFAREEREALRRSAAAVLALPGRELPLGDVQPGGAAEVRRLHRHRRDRGAGRHRRELGARDARGLDRGDRAQDQHGGGRGGGAADAAARPRRADRHRLHRHGGPAQQRRRREEAQGQAEDRPRAHPGRAHLGLRAAGDVAPAAAAGHDRGDDQGLPALPRHRAGALGRLAWRWRSCARSRRRACGSARRRC